jgi:hypothetical protein
MKTGRDWRDRQHKWQSIHKHQSKQPDIDPRPSCYVMTRAEWMPWEADAPCAPSSRERTDLRERSDMRASWNGDGLFSDGSRLGETREHEMKRDDATASWSRRLGKTEESSKRIAECYKGYHDTEDADCDVDEQRNPEWHWQTRREDQIWQGIGAGTVTSAPI